MIRLTIGRRTDQRVNALLKDIAYSLLSTNIMRRGKTSLTGPASRLRDEGMRYTLAFFRGHGELGRIDFFDVQQTDVALLVPSLLVKVVKLRREYGENRRFIAQAITSDVAASDEATKHQ